MKLSLLSALLISLTGCGMRAASPMAVGGSYQVRFSDSEAVFQVRVLDKAGDWARVQYLEGSPALDHKPEDWWVNSNHIVWFAPYKPSHNPPLERTGRER